MVPAAGFALSIGGALIAKTAGAFAMLLILPGSFAPIVSIVYTVFKLTGRQHDSLQASWARFFHAQA
ncbi:MAG TPA: hypothetical protein D7I09_06430 [Candidatus Poseidoniales archaeon]|nr:MAG TPA: hypothetical protein D7I09_06430 [Candidatus Poseidoniales archaeon]DAC16287.1 MAG TPA: hypothetical protein D7I01_05980 [Candidatus Poseidoniales archaeon]